MRITGFVQEHASSSKIREISVPFKEQPAGHFAEAEKKAILEYLNSGKEFAATMNVAQSLIPDDNKIFFGVSYLTDGAWIWPNYFSYYLEHHNLALGDDFYAYLRAKKFLYSIPSDKQVEEAIGHLKLLLS